MHFCTIFKFYRESFSGFPSIIKKYSPQTDSIKVEFYSTKGTLQTKGIFIGKERIGTWKEYNPKGEIVLEENF